MTQTRTRTLSDQIAQLQANINTQTNAATQKIGKTAACVKYLYQLSAAAVWIIKPPLKTTWRTYIYIQHIYRRYIWNKLAYNKQNKFSKVRGGITLLATIIFLWFLLLPIIDLLFSAVFFAATEHVKEPVYLLGSQEIDSTSGSHVIEGCYKLPCSDQDAIYFRTENGPLENIWALLKYHHLFYPEYVGAAIPNNVSKCLITSYGIRYRLPFRLINTYSYMLAVVCQPI